MMARRVDTYRDPILVLNPMRECTATTSSMLPSASATISRASSSLQCVCVCVGVCTRCVYEVFSTALVLQWPFYFSRNQNTLSAAPLFNGEPLHLTKVNESQAAVLQQQNIPRVRVAVEYPWRSEIHVCVLCVRVCVCVSV